MKRLEKLCSLPGVSGDEKEVRDFLRKEYEKRNLEIIEDKLGSIFGKKLGASDLNLMISSNIDESGMMVSQIREDGKLEFLTVGLYEKKELNQQKVFVLDRRHNKYPGIITKIEKELVVDIGCDSLAEVNEKGLLIGDFIVIKSSYQKLGEHKILSNNLSNRAGIELGLQLIDCLDDEQLDYDLNIGGISHSVVGQRGAITATTTVKPDLAIVVDFSYVKDIKKDAVYIRSFDKTLLPSQLLKHTLYDKAKELSLTPLANISKEATDGAFIHKSLSGTPTIVLVVPLAYKKAIHNVLDLEDMNHAIKLLERFLTDLTKEEITKIQYDRGNRYE